MSVILYKVPLLKPYTRNLYQTIINTSFTIPPLTAKLSVKVALLPNLTINICKRKLNRLA